jgi:hypothetical protein
MNEFSLAVACFSWIQHHPFFHAAAFRALILSLALAGRLARRGGRQQLVPALKRRACRLNYPYPVMTATASMRSCPTLATRLAMDNHISLLRYGGVYEAGT